MTEPKIEIAPTNDLCENLEIEKKELDGDVIVRDPVEGGKGGAIEVDLPGSLYSTLMIIPLCKNLGKDAYQNFMIVLQIAFLHAINMYVQSQILWSVKLIYDDNHAEYGECGGYDGVDVTLRALCILIYTTYCVSDLTETLKMTMFTIYFRRTSRFQPLKYAVTNVDGVEEKDFATGMTWVYKLYIYAVVLFPKFVIAVYLLVWGTGFVVTTDDSSDVVLNALALGFVLDLDEMIYQLLPTQMIEIIEELPSVPLSKGRMTSWNKEYGMFFKGFGIGSLTFFTYLMFCPEDQ